jgi:hypothetical protein
VWHFPIHFLANNKTTKLIVMAESLDKNPAFFIMIAGQIESAMVKITSVIVLCIFLVSRA